VIIAGQLIDGTGADPVSDAFVEFEGPTIVAVGPLSQLTATRREGARVLDHHDSTVMPGLIDCHVHLVYPRYYRGQDLRIKHSIEYTALKAARNAAILLQSGYTTVRDMGTQGHCAIAVRDAVETGLIQGAKVVASGSIVTAIGGLGDPYPSWVSNRNSSAVTISGRDDIQRVVREQLKSGVDFIKLGASGGEASAFSNSWLPALTFEEMEVACSTAHRHRRRVAAHAQATESIKEALRAGVDTIEHGTFLDEEGLELFKSHGAFLVPTLCTIYSFLELGYQTGAPADVVKELEDNERPWIESLRMCREAGVRIAAGGDVGNRYPQGSNARELEHLVTKGGLRPLEALTAATGTAADAIGLQGQVGRLEGAYLADVLVIDGDPATDISVLQDRRRFRALFQNGIEVRIDPQLAETFPRTLQTTL